MAQYHRLKTKVFLLINKDAIYSFLTKGISGLGEGSRVLPFGLVSPFREWSSGDKEKH